MSDMCLYTETKECRSNLIKDLEFYKMRFKMLAFWSFWFQLPNPKSTRIRRFNVLPYFWLLLKTHVFLTLGNDIDKDGSNIIYWLKRRIHIIVWLEGWIQYDFLHRLGRSNIIVWLKGWIQHHCLTESSSQISFSDCNFCPIKSLTT